MYICFEYYFVLGIGTADHAVCRQPESVNFSLHLVVEKIVSLLPSSLADININF